MLHHHAMQSFMLPKQRMGIGLSMLRTTQKEAGAKKTPV